jgi:hypothetical protein
VVAQQTENKHYKGEIMGNPKSEEQCGACRHYEEDRTCFLDKGINSGADLLGEDVEFVTPEPIRYSPSNAGCAYFEPRTD